MNHTQLLARIETAWSAFRGSYTGLTEAALMAPGVSGDWSVRDLIAHVTWWEEEALRYLPLILQGGRPPRYRDLYGGIDAFNARETEHRRALPLAELLARQEATHARLLALVRGVPGEAIARETPFRRRLRLDSYGHYPEHTRQILAWRQAGEEPPGRGS